MSEELLLWTLVTGTLSALATGLGALAILFIRSDSDVWRGFANAFAAGMMLSASVFSLAQEGIEMSEEVDLAALQVIGGLLLGTLFFWGLAERIETADETKFSQLGLDTRSLLLFLGLFVHSMPEGIAIGVGFATGDLNFGLVMAIAISIHNIPEGIAMSLPMHAEGASLSKCAGFSVLTSVPQPLLAVPAAYGFYLFEPILPLGLGFAGGAMIYIVVLDLIPSALELGSRAVAAWGVMLGLSAMLLISVLLPA
jgi:zinc transporter ZupT